jgi:hypothetical protein
MPDKKYSREEVLKKDSQFVADMTAQLNEFGEKVGIVSDNNSGSKLIGDNCPKRFSIEFFKGNTTKKQEAPKFSK